MLSLDSVPDYTMKVVRINDEGHAVAEQQTIHGANHAWTAGNPKDLYTDPK